MINVLKAVAVMLAVMLSGCATTPPVNVRSDVSCRVFKPITYSSRDTPETQTEINEHNAVWDSICQKEGEL